MHGNGMPSLARLLLKYYEPESGDITIDGVDINEYQNSSIRRAISYVPQNIELFSKSIYDNIRVSKPTVSLDEVKEAAKKLMLMILLNVFQCSIIHILRKLEL